MPKVGRAGKAQIRDHKIKQLVRSNRPPNHIRGEVQEQQLHPNPKEFAVCAGLWVAGRACVDCRCERNIYSVHSGRTCLFTHFIACHLSIPTTIWNHWKETETHSHIHSTRVHPHEEERHGRKRGAECGQGQAWQREGHRNVSDLPASCRERCTQTAERLHRSTWSCSTMTRRQCTY